MSVGLSGKQEKRLLRYVRKQADNEPRLQVEVAKLGEKRGFTVKGCTKDVVRLLQRLVDGLDAEQQKAFVALTMSDDFSTVALVSADSEMWARVRVAFPPLATMSDEDLSATLDSCTAWH